MIWVITWAGWSVLYRTSQDHRFILSTNSCFLSLVSVFLSCAISHPCACLYFPAALRLYIFCTYLFTHVHSRHYVRQNHYSEVRILSIFVLQRFSWSNYTWMIKTKFNPALNHSAHEAALVTVCSIEYQTKLPCVCACKPSHVLAETV